MLPSDGGGGDAEATAKDGEAARHGSGSRELSDLFGGSFWAGVNPEWRAKLEWCLRTATSTLVAVVVLFTPQVRTTLVVHGIVPAAPSFTGFLVVMVADVTFGRTAINAWGCLLLSAGATILSAGVLAAMQCTHSPAVALPALAATVFALQLLKVPLMGKRLGLSLLALNLVEEVPAAQAECKLWKPALYLMADVVLGSAIAFVGVLLPWPRLATTELHGRLRYAAGALGRVLESLVDGLRGVRMERTSLHAAHRRELLRCVRSNAEVCRARLVESRWGPRRRDALSRDARYLSLIDDLLLGLETMNALFARLDFAALPAHDLLMSKVAGPAAALQSDMLDLFALSAQEFQQFQAAGLRETGPWTEALQSAIAGRLANSMEAFERAYFEARAETFYSDRSIRIEPQGLLVFNAFLAELERLAEVLVSSTTHDASGQGQPTASCCGAALRDDLLPPQRAHCARYCAWPLSLPARRELIAAFKLSLAMTAAGAYGFFGTRIPGQRSLAAFTIAFVGTDANQGSNVTAAVLRAFATALAAAYAALVSGASSAMPQPAREVFIGAATVAFVIPATYMRTCPDVSYAGTVAGFTAVLLLLAAPSDDVSSLSVQRVLDTFVGTFILLAVEVLVLPLRSEQQLLGDLGAVMAGLHKVS